MSDPLRRQMSILSRTHMNSRCADCRAKGHRDGGGSSGGGTTGMRRRACAAAGRALHCVHSCACHCHSTRICAHRAIATACCRHWCRRAVCVCVCVSASVCVVECGRVSVCAVRRMPPHTTKRHEVAERASEQAHSHAIQQYENNGDDGEWLRHAPPHH